MDQKPHRGTNIVFTILGVVFLCGFCFGLLLGVGIASGDVTYKVGEWEMECLDDATFPGVRCYGYCGSKDAAWHPVQGNVEEPQ